MAAVIEQARTRYGRLAATVQLLFTKHLEVSGWPPSGRLANADVFDRLVAPKLQESGRRVAYVLIDALRYELGVALAQQLADTGHIQLHAACAQLPSITSVGMASLLPGDGQHRKPGAAQNMLCGTPTQGIESALVSLRRQDNEVSSACRADVENLLDYIPVPHRPVPCPSLMARLVDRRHLTCGTDMHQREGDRGTAQAVREPCGHIHCGLRAWHLIDGGISMRRSVTAPLSSAINPATSWGRNRVIALARRATGSATVRCSQRASPHVDALRAPPDREGAH
jgi:hypothetical protein